MQANSHELFDKWRDEGSKIVAANLKTFREVVSQAKAFAQQNEDNMAAIFADLAADYAFAHHGGLFSSPDLDRLLVSIGKDLIPVRRHPSRSRSASPKRQHVLHVATGLPTIGGITSFIGRWIHQDAKRRHSVVFTRQLRLPVPENIRAAVSRSGGTITRLNGSPGTILGWASRLRKLAQAADFVVMHTSTHDVIPVIAFADARSRPPIIYINHADHVLSLGVPIIDMFVNLRTSGLHLSEYRRGVAAERNALLPTLVAEGRRSNSRAEAKRKLGLSDNSVVLLSVARKLKFRTVDGVSYAAAHLPILEKYENAVLITVGSGVQEDWTDDIRRAQGRIIALAEQEKPHLYFEAADIYVDSYPFVSNTSLLEAGCYGLPLVSRYPFPQGCEVLGADMPGLTGTLIRAETLDDYRGALSRLIEDVEYRLELGAETRKNIMAAHAGATWQQSLEDLYTRVSGMPRNDAPCCANDEMRIDELDMFMPHVHNCMADGRAPDVQDLVRSRLRLMPLEQRIRQWHALNRERGGEDWFGTLPYMVPEWLLCQTRPLWKGRLSNPASGRAADRAA